MTNRKIKTMTKIHFPTEAERWSNVPGYKEGFADGLTDKQDYESRATHEQKAGVWGQAYDRGLWAGRQEYDRYHWGDDPTIGERVGLN